LQEKFADLLTDADRATKVANTAIGGLQDFLATFKDNPGRRLISIYLGAILGLLVAGFFGLDVFAAATRSVSTATTASVSTCPRFMVLLTGVIIGLGSNPTHEVIRAVQEFKKGQKGENTSKPNLPSKPV